MNLRFHPYFTFAWRYFKAKKSAQAINVIAWVTACVIAFATCCQILVLSVFNGFEDLVKSLYASFYSDIRILPADGKTVILDANMINRLKNIPDVSALSLTAEERALIRHEQGQMVVTLKGVDNQFSQVSGVPETMAEGSFETGDAEKPELVMGSGIRYAAGISLDPALGSPPLSVILPINKATGSDPLDMLSEGTAAPSGMFAIQQEFDDNYVFTNLDFMRRQMRFGPDEYSAAEIRIKNGADISNLRDRLQRLLGNSFRVQTKYEQNDSLYHTMRLEKWAIYAVLTLILLIAAFNMISALTMLVLEKRQDIQILKSMGASQPMIKKIFLSEGMLLGMIGTVAGIILATLICTLQLKFKWIKLTGGAFLIDHFPVKLVVWDFLLVAVTACVISLGASWFPARKAAMQPFMIR